MNKVQLWVQKYRPKTMEDIVLPQSIKERFKEGIVDTHILLGGSPGTGKTSLAKILTENHQTLFLNGSDDRKIDVVRNQVVQFCATNSLMKKATKKVVWFDEAEKLTLDAQEALKGIIEKYESAVYFVFTSNHPKKIIEPLHSRFEMIDYDAEIRKDELEMKKAYGKKLFEILKSEGFSIDAPALNYLVHKIFPDLRKITGLLYSATRGLNPGETVTLDRLKASVDNTDNKLYEFLLTSYTPEQIFTFVTGEYLSKEVETMRSLGEPFLKYLMTTPHKDKVLQVAMVVHKYTYEATTGDVDPLIPLLALCGNLSQLLK